MGNVARANTRACVGVGLPVWLCTSWCVARRCVYPDHASVYIFALQVYVCVCVCVCMCGDGGWVVVTARDDGGWGLNVAHVHVQLCTLACIRYKRSTLGSRIGRLTA